MKPSPLQLSAVIITQNAATSLSRCLESLKPIVDEIIIVDSGSVDETLVIAKRFNTRIFHQSWLGFGPQKQFATVQSTFDWILSLDADEWLSLELQQSLLSFKKTVASYYAYQFSRRNRFLGRFLKHGEAYPDRNIRLFHKEYAMWSDDLVHEKMVTKEAVGYFTGDLLHDSAETLENYLQKQNRYTSLQAETIASKHQPISVIRPISSAIFRFIKGYIFRLGFLDGLAGFTHIFIASSNTFYKYVKAIERQRTKKE